MATLKDKIQAYQIRFGVEIEVVGLTRPQAIMAIKNVEGMSPNYNTSEYGRGGNYIVDRHNRRWNAVTDGSISPRGCEVVTPPLGYNDMEMLQRVLRALRAAGAYCNVSCGQHVHVSSPQLDYKAVARLSRTFHKWDAYIRKSGGVQDRRTGEYGPSGYCWITPSSVVEALEDAAKQSAASFERAWYRSNEAAGANGRYGYSPQGRYHNSRYNALNLNSFFFRGTVEFRQFEGTTHAGKMKANVQLAIAMVIKAIEGKRVRKDAMLELPTDKDILAFKWYYYIVCQLGLKGDEFKTARLHLMSKLDGNVQKGERKVKAARQAARQA